MNNRSLTSILKCYGNSIILRHNVQISMQYRFVQFQQIDDVLPRLDVYTKQTVLSILIILNANVLFNRGIFICRCSKYQTTKCWFKSLCIINLFIYLISRQGLITWLTFALNPTILIFTLTMTAYIHTLLSLSVAAILLYVITLPLFTPK